MNVPAIGISFIAISLAFASYRIKRARPEPTSDSPYRDARTDALLADLESVHR